MDPSENVNFNRVNLRSLPVHGPNLGWNRCNYDDAVLEFPQIHEDDFTMITHGNFQLAQADKYITQMSEQDSTQEALQDDQIDWNVYDTLAAALPQDKVVYYVDEEEEHANWNPNHFGPWFPRRLVLMNMRSLHSNNLYKVIIAYIPSSRPFPPNFQNRLGFTQDELLRIVGYCCVDRLCVPGCRLAGADSHVSAAILLMGIYATRPQLFSSTHRRIHLFDNQNSRRLNKDLLAS